MLKGKDYSNKNMNFFFGATFRNTTLGNFQNPLLTKLRTLYFDIGNLLSYSSSKARTAEKMAAGNRLKYWIAENTYKGNGLSSKERQFLYFEVSYAQSYCRKVSRIEDLAYSDASSYNHLI